MWGTYGRAENGQITILGRVLRLMKTPILAKMGPRRMSLTLLVGVLPPYVLSAFAPPPPYGLPPWSPGAAPPVPGPVFSSAFNALLVLLALGCIALGINLRDALKKMYASDIGTDNELLTSGGVGNAEWLASVQRSGGRRAGELPPVPPPKPKGKKGSKSKPKPRHADDDDIIGDENGLEMAALQPSARSGKKTPRPKR